MRVPALIFAAVALIAGPAGAQSVDDQLKQQQLEAAILANQKARLGLTDPLRALVPPDAKIATPEKAAEAVLLRIMVYQGLAGRLADQLAIPDKADPSTLAPMLVMGSVPPTRAHWAAFDAQRASLAKEMAAGIARWRLVRAAYCKKHGGCGQSLSLVPAAGAAVEVAATLYSLLKTDRSVTGASLQASDGDFASYILHALQARLFTVDLNRYGTPDAKADADDLLAPLATDHTAIRSAYTDQFLPLVAGAEGGKPEKIGDSDVAAAGQVLKALLDSYDTLEKSLYVESGGITAGSTIVRERVMPTDRTTAPVIFVTGQDAALTTTTRKGVFVRAATATTMTAVSSATYAIVTGDQTPGAAPRREVVSARLGSLTCAVHDRQPAKLLTFDVAADPTTWSGYCDGAPPPPQQMPMRRNSRRTTASLP